MALYTPVEEIIALLGHDGSEIIWPQFPEPFCRRGFHIQELIFIAWRNHSRTVTPFQAEPMIGCLGGEPVDVPHLPDAKWRMPELLSSNCGVLTGKTLRGMPHAVAWDAELVYDTDGMVYGLDGFQLETFWMVK